MLTTAHSGQTLAFALALAEEIVAGAAATKVLEGFALGLLWVVLKALSGQECAEAGGAGGHRLTANLFCQDGNGH